MLSFNCKAQHSFSNKKEITLLKSENTFKNFEDDLINISKTSNIWSVKYAKKVSHDVIKLAKAKHLKSVDIILLDVDNKPIIAKKYIIGLKNSVFKRKGIKQINWSAPINSSLAVVLNYNLSWYRLSYQLKKEFTKKHNLKIRWITSYLNTTYSHLKEGTKPF